MPIWAGIGIWFLVTPAVLVVLLSLSILVQALWEGLDSQKAWADFWHTLRTIYWGHAVQALPAVTCGLVMSLVRRRGPTVMRFLLVSALVGSLAFSTQWAVLTAVNYALPDSGPFVLRAEVINVMVIALAGGLSSVVSAGLALLAWRNKASSNYADTF